MKKAQGLPIYAIVVIIIGLIALAVVLLYLLGVFGRGESLSNIFFGYGSNITQNASEEASNFVG